MPRSRPPYPPEYRRKMVELVKVESVSCTASPPSVDPAVCNNSQIFTSQVLGVPVAVTAGQQILVTVRLSFS